MHSNLSFGPRAESLSTIAAERLSSLLNGAGRDLVLFVSENLVAYDDALHDSGDIAPVTLVPDSRGAFRAASSTTKSGDWVLYEPQQRRITVNVSMGCPYPCYYAAVGEAAILARSPILVRNVLKALGKNVSIDRRTALLSICCDGMPGRATNFAGVFRTRGLEHLTIEDWQRTTHSFALRAQFDLPELRDLTLEHAIRRYCEVFEALRLPSDDMLLPLSGGLDSRLLLGLALRKGLRPICYTFRVGPSFETTCAQAVAREMKVRFHDISLPAEAYKSFASDWSVATGGMLTGAHTHGLYAVSTLSREERTLSRTFGYYGDPVAGAFQNAGQAKRETEDDLRQLFFTGFLCDPAQVRIAGEWVDEEIAEFYRNYHAPEHRLTEAFKLFVRQDGLITHIFSYHELEAPVWRPFLNRDYIRFGLGLPARLRANRRAFAAACRHMFPRLFSIASTRVPDGVAGLVRQADMFSRAAISRSLAMLCGPRLGATWNNRYAYEQHRLLFRTTLRGRYLDAFKKVSEILDVEINPEILLDRAKFPAAFRVLALNDLFRRLS